MCVGMCVFSERAFLANPCPSRVPFPYSIPLLLVMPTAQKCIWGGNVHHHRHRKVNPRWKAIYVVS